MKPTAFWCGTYTGESGTGRGIEALGVAEGERLEHLGTAAVADSPSFLAAHPRLDVVYAACEFLPAVQAFRRTGETTLEPFGDAWPAGDAVCHVRVDPLGRYIVAACWGDGRVLLYELDAEGAIVSRHEAPPAIDPAAGAVRPSRAHASLLLPDGRIATTDLGYDLVRVWRYRPGNGLVPDHELELPGGSGPRHLALHPSGHVYVVTELSCEVAVVGQDASGRLELVSIAPAMTGGANGDTAAEITIGQTGEHVHVTVRGSNVIATLRASDGGRRLEPIAAVDCGGEQPRHHIESGELLRVANQRSGTVTTFRLEGASGVPTELIDTLQVASPACLLPAG